MLSSFEKIKAYKTAADHYDHDLQNDFQSLVYQNFTGRSSIFPFQTVIYYH